MVLLCCAFTTKRHATNKMAKRKTKLILLAVAMESSVLKNELAIHQPPFASHAFPRLTNFAGKPGPKGVANLPNTAQTLMYGMHGLARQHHRRLVVRVGSSSTPELRCVMAMESPLALHPLSAVPATTAFHPLRHGCSRLRQRSGGTVRRCHRNRRSAPHT